MSSRARNEGMSASSLGTAVNRSRCSQTDLIAWSRTVVRSMQDCADPVGQIKLIFDSATAQIDALAGFLSKSSISNSGQLNIERIIDIGEWSTAARSQRDRYAKDCDAFPDPFVEAFMKDPKFGGPFAARREDLISDKAWYESPHYKEFRIPAGQDACMYISTSFRDLASGTKVLWTVCFVRAIGAPQFTEEERDLAFAFLHSVEPILADIFREPQTDLESQIFNLPHRLRRVLGGIQSGLSEKEIASQLSLSPHTVHGYVKELYVKFAVRSRAELLIATLPNRNSIT